MVLTKTEPESPVSLVQYLNSPTDSAAEGYSRLMEQQSRNCVTSPSSRDRSGVTSKQPVLAHRILGDSTSQTARQPIITPQRGQHHATMFQHHHAKQNPRLHPRSPSPAAARGPTGQSPSGDGGGGASPSRGGGFLFR
jgi:hypothetical protein